MPLLLHPHPSLTSLPSLVGFSGCFPMEDIVPVTSDLHVGKMQHKLAR